MTKKLKLDIKNTQIAQAINLGSLKDKLAQKKSAKKKDEETETLASKTTKEEETPRVRARTKSAFVESSVDEASEAKHAETSPTVAEGEQTPPKKIKARTGKRQEDKGEPQPQEEEVAASLPVDEPPFISEVREEKKQVEVVVPTFSAKEETPPIIQEQKVPLSAPPQPPPPAPVKAHDQPRQKLGPTGQHISDLLPHKYGKIKEATPPPAKPAATPTAKDKEDEAAKAKAKAKGKPPAAAPAVAVEEEKKGATKFKEFRDVKPTKRSDGQRTFDVRDRQGLREGDEEYKHRKRRMIKQPRYQEDTTIRPTELSIRIPISIKDLAVAMKLKASELIGKMFLHGVALTINTILEDETTIQLLGQEFGCAITIDRTEEQRIRITDKAIREEIGETPKDQLITRAPVVAFMGHVDHGKTSLIDFIRKTNRAAGEAGAITQHIGAFRCSTAVGDIAILDTPGHEAFSAMRARGAEVTDIVVLVVAGDEGIRQQTLEAMQRAKEAKVTIIVAINKCDKPNFNADNVYRQLAENDLLPESWGGQIITVNCSAITGEGIPALLEMLALQAEVLELKANPKSRARGTVLESEMHKGMGAVATILVQNGTLRMGDALVCDRFSGRVKTMRDEFGRELREAGPSTPVEITGLSGLPEAGQEFIVVKNEREAHEIAEARIIGVRQKALHQPKKISVENMFQQASETVQKKIFPIILRADVQGSLEALKSALQKIESKKVELNILFAGVGEVSESDVQLGATSKAAVFGFHTKIESHADQLVKQLGVQVRMHDIIYHAVDDVKALMITVLDKIAQENEKGKAEVRAVFKSSQHGLIAGCQVTEGIIQRNHLMRVRRGDAIIWKGSIASLKRVKEDVREVQKGVECGILLNGFADTQVGDILEAYDITYITQEL